MIDIAIVWRAFIVERVPYFLRTVLLLDYLSLLSSQLEALHALFIEQAVAGRIRAGLTSSRLALEAYLRDVYDEGINIIDVGTVRQSLLYREEHLRVEPVIYREEHLLQSIVLYREENDVAVGYSFIVEIPTASASLESQVRAEVNKIKPCNTNYNIELI